MVIRNTLLFIIIWPTVCHAEPGGDLIAFAMEKSGLNDAIDAAFGVEPDDDGGGDD